MFLHTYIGAALSLAYWVSEKFDGLEFINKNFQISGKPSKIRNGIDRSRNHQKVVVNIELSKETRRVSTR